MLVPGNFLPPAYYANTAKLLESHGFQTRAVSIPSTGSKVPLTSNEPDVRAVREVLEELCESGKDSVVVAHSYGSIPACEAAKGLGTEERLKLAKPGGVAKLIFLAAWLLQEGESPPDIIAKYKVEASWARFEVNRSSTSNSFRTITDPTLPDFNRMGRSSPMTLCMPSTMIVHQMSQPTGRITSLIPTSRLLQPHSNMPHGAISLPPTWCVI